MRICIVALGHKMPAWVTEGASTYGKRLPPDVRLDWIELKPEDRANRPIDKVLAREADRIDAAVPKGATRIVCDERGTLLTTSMLAGWLGDWMRDGTTPTFIVGSADGLAPRIRDTADRTISLSGCVLPHGLVRVLLAEQLYRAWCIRQGHPYHRE